ncbi:hypothetical protein FDB08_02465 [Clostridium botulinum]|nr:hypothetical protein [Clostridium botulinum]NFL02120.1 hypothetical protein [Clostridium botulinum]
MDKETFRKTEGKLYRYFEGDNKISSLKYKIEILNKQIDYIEKKISSTDITIPEESRAISYEERVQGSGDCTSYAEKTLIRIIDSLLKEQSRKKEEIAILEEQIRTIEADNSILEKNIRDLQDEDKKFLKIKYSKGRISDFKVGQVLGMDQSTATRKRQRLVEDVSRWEMWFRH